MAVKLDINTILTTAVLGLVGWIFTTVQAVDKNLNLVMYQVDEFSDQAFHRDCPFCNHHLHGSIKDWLND